MSDDYSGGLECRVGGIEHGEHRISLKLHDAAAARLDLLAGDALKLIDYSERTFLIPRGELGVADDVGEPDGGEPARALFCHSTDM